MADRGVRRHVDTCRCGLDGDQRDCVGGEIYGPCDHERCSGVCEHETECVCTCHTDTGTDG